MLAVELLPYRYPHSSTTNVNAKIKTKNVIRVPEKAQSVDEWMQTWTPLLSSLPKDAAN
jgi:DNA-directed RNA polymerase subunit L